MPQIPPDDKQISQFSKWLQLFIMSLLCCLAYLVHLKYFPFYGILVYFLLFFGLRRIIARDHYSGVRLLKKCKYREAIQRFKNSYEFFVRHFWIDRCRYFLLLSISSVSYREKALLSIACSYGLAGDKKNSNDYYLRVIEEFPKSVWAELIMHTLETNNETTNSEHNNANEPSTGKI